MAERERRDRAPLVGCGDLAFRPALAYQLSNPVADSPTGMRMELMAPEGEARASSPTRRSRTSTIEHARWADHFAAGGRAANPCSDAQFGLGRPKRAALCVAGRQRWKFPRRRAELVARDHLSWRGHPSANVSGSSSRSPGTGHRPQVRRRPAADLTAGRLSTTLRDLPQVSVQTPQSQLRRRPRRACSLRPWAAARRRPRSSCPTAAGRRFDSSASVVDRGQLPAAAARATSPFAPDCVPAAPGPWPVATAPSPDDPAPPRWRTAAAPVLDDLAGGPQRRPGQGCRRVPKPMRPRRPAPSEPCRQTSCARSAPGPNPVPAARRRLPDRALPWRTLWLADGASGPRSALSISAR